MSKSAVKAALQLAVLVLMAAFACAQTSPVNPPAPPSTPANATTNATTPSTDATAPQTNTTTPPPPIDLRKPMTPEGRVNLIRGLQAEFVFVKRPFPEGKQGLTLKDGKVGPGDDTIRMLVAKYGATAHPGDRAQITNIIIGDDNIILELNGGPQKKSKWYQRIEVGGMGGTTPIAKQNNTEYAKGSMLTWKFDHFVPDMTTEQAKAALAPLFDFSTHTATQMFTASLPPKVQDAIKNHKVLVGMDREMVTAAKGRPDQKIREKDAQGNPYEEWMYGQPPQEVDFVRFNGDKVVRLEIMPVDGAKIVKTENEVDANAVAAAKPPEEKKTAAPAKRPTLYKPGEEHPKTANQMEPVVVPPNSSGNSDEPEWGKPKTDSTNRPDNDDSKDATTPPSDVTTTPPSAVTVTPPPSSPNAPPATTPPTGTTTSTPPQR
jgi:hypothetical protein